MSLRGSLRTMPVEDLLDWVDRRFVCGNLTVERGTTVRTFHFDSGYVTGASSNDPTEYLGQLLINRGHITDKQLNEAFAVQADTGVRLGKILLMVGAVQETHLRQVLEEKIRESLFDALAWNEGAFQFDRAPELPMVSAFEVSVNLRTAMVDGAKRVMRWRELREIVPDDSAAFFLSRREAGLEPGDSESVRAELERLLCEVESGGSVNEIVLRCHGARFAVLSGLVKLFERGALSLERRQLVRSSARERSARELERLARGRAARGDRAGALEMAREALEQEPESEPLKKLHRELERSVFAELSRDLLGRFTVPKLKMSRPELDQLEMSATERYLVSRIDGRWDILSLMRVSPLGEVEALLTFKRLADRGIISL